jgi:hypothetical protein
MIVLQKMRENGENKNAAKNSSGICEGRKKFFENPF